MYASMDIFESGKSKVGNSETVRTYEHSSILLDELHVYIFIDTIFAERP